MITLIIVDCQNDFITGTMSCKNSRKVIDEIKKFINSNKNKIDKIIFTIKWHPYNHCSFNRFGGKYPSNCVQYTPGACIEPKLLKYVQSLNITYEVSTREENKDREQIGAFEEVEFVTDGSLIDKYYFDSLVTADGNTEFVICGINSYSNIIYTIKNLLNGEIVPKVFKDGIFYIDNETSKFIKENKLKEYGK